MKKAVIILIAGLTVPAGLAAKELFEFKAEPAFIQVNAQKTSRLPDIHQQQSVMIDAHSEWTADCYDAFGPDGEEENAADLAACLKG
ncbi:hypothetical protein [Rhizobium paknamense]|uniref:Uncharacterized protein n=1 Tax=Rhizobium paknamense TaxID=1206817 RepID=A0ABU0I9E8_9HYPH|nr:hypothetical protein [Rhizobium paknamense]MDQ0454855.1 hypothetical protein [Rhizobium paknamense]